MYRPAFVVALLLLASPVLAQSENDTPVRIEALVEEGAVITGHNTNTDQNDSSSGVTGIGVTGVLGQGQFYGGMFHSDFSGVTGIGERIGVQGMCSGETCRGVEAAARGTAVFALGRIGVMGVSTTAVTYDPYVPVPSSLSLAGYFVGPVHVTEDLSIAGTLSAPTIDRLYAEVAALTVRLAALENANGRPSAPGRIEAEAYDAGGQGVGYSDSTAGNEGGAFRQDDVDIKALPEGGYAVGWITAGEWLAYTVDVQTDDVYTLTARVGTALAGRTFRFTVDGQTVGGSLAVPQFADWEIFGDVTVTGVSLRAGRRVVRVVAGPADYLDLDAFTITR